jgi:hypothetical protein
MFVHGPKYSLRSLQFEKVNLLWSQIWPFLGRSAAQPMAKSSTEPKAAETNFLEDTMLAPTLASGSVTSYSTA